MCDLVALRLNLVTSDDVFCDRAKQKPVETKLNFSQQISTIKNQSRNEESTPSAEEPSNHYQKHICFDSNKIIQNKKGTHQDCYFCRIVPLHPGQTVHQLHAYLVIDQAVGNDKSVLFNVSTGNMKVKLCKRRRKFKAN